MKLYIKNMVCDRCKTIVESALDKMGIRYFSVQIGEILIRKELTSEQFCGLKNVLLLSGLEMVEEEINVVFEKLKSAITDLEQHTDEDLKTSCQEYISLRLKSDFNSLNLLFSEIEGMTIEKYIIRHKVELVKELLNGNKFNLTEIALKMHYSNKAQLSSQFKSITGLTPSGFRRLRLSNYHRIVCN
jgi:YesN/AraC family two-component response regulator